jgi:integrase
MKESLFTDYQKARLDKGDKPASINRPLQMIRQAYALAAKQIPRPPSFTMLSESGNVRREFFTEAEFRTVLSHLSSDLRDFVAFAGACGMRKNELASLTWDMVEGNELLIPGDITKNREPRVLPIVGEMTEIIERRRSARRIEVGGTVRMVEHVFHRDGEPVREFRKSWARACVRAQVGAMICPKCESNGDRLTCDACNVATVYHGKIFHSLRRFAVRNSIKAGVPTQLAKLWSGHKSDAVFERYSILDTNDMREAFEKTEQYRKQAASKDKIRAMR